MVVHKRIGMSGHWLRVASTVLLVASLTGATSVLSMPQTVDAEAGSDCGCGSMVTPSPDEPIGRLVQGSDESDERTRKHTPPITVWEERNSLLATLQVAFLKLGCEGSGEATELAKMAYEALNPIDRPGGKGKLDWRNSDPHTVLRDAFIAVGIDGDDALALAAVVLGDMNMRQRADDGTITSLREAEVPIDRTHLETLVAEHRDTWHAELEKRKEARRTAPPVLVWHAGNLQPKLHQVFRTLGWEGQEAADLAELAFHTLNPTNDPDRFEGQNPYDVVAEALVVAGYPRSEATGLAVATLTEMGLQRPITGEMTEAEMTQCHVYTVSVIWCEGETRKKDTFHIHKAIWESITACPKPFGYACPETDWYTMHSSGDCNPYFPGEGICFWISEVSGPQWITCHDNIIERECVDELDPTTNCSAIEIECGDADDGPDGCPCDE